MAKAGKGEVRVAVGSPDAERSTVWKFWVVGNDAYILSRMMGSDMKVSLHELGQGQISGTGTWVLKDSTRRNQDRHFERWQMPRYTGFESALVFQIGIPVSELRVVNLVEELRGVHWIPAPPAGMAVTFQCYISPPSESDPVSALPAAVQRLAAMQLEDTRWFVVLYHVHATNDAKVRYAKDGMRQEAVQRGIPGRPEFRGCAVLVDGDRRGLLEVCPFD